MATTVLDGYSVKDVAKALDLSPDTILRRIKTNQIDALIVGDRLWLTSQAIIDAVERGLGSKAPDERDAAIQAAEARERDAENRNNPPVQVPIDMIGEQPDPRGKRGTVITQAHSFPKYDSRSGYAVAQHARSVAEQAARDKQDAESGVGDAGRRSVSIVRRIGGRPKDLQGDPVPAGVSVALDDRNGDFEQQMRDSRVTA